MSKTRKWTARRVKKVRAELEMTQKAFADAIGVSHVCVYFWEAGRTKPEGVNKLRLEAFEALADREAS